MSDVSVLIEGVWHLSSFEKRNPRGEVVFPFGRNAKGMLSYTKDGYMFACLMDGGRESIGSSLESLALPGFKNFGRRMKYAGAAARSLSYAGRYEIHGSDISHDVYVSSFPDWVGASLLRGYSFKGESLVLTFSDEFGSVSTLTWGRA